MRLSDRSYPHPVLGNADDVPGAAFQATCDVESDKQFFFFDVTVACSSTTLQKLIQNGGACFVLHVECSNTLYRNAFDFTEKSKRFGVRADRLNGTVEINCFIRAAKDVSKYQIAGAHEDYENNVFEIKPGDILAVAPGQTFEAESLDTLRRIGSIMIIEESPKLDEHPMEVEFNSDKIHIRLSKQDFNLYKELKAIPALASHLTTTLVLPVLTEALHLIQKDSLEFEDRKWCRSLNQRLADLKLSHEADLLRAAQILLDRPIRRALTSAAQYAQDR
jgi:hypothetical protein